MDLREKLLRMVVVPPDDDRTPDQIVDWLLSQEYRCADCGDMRPADLFAWRKVPATTRGQRRFGAVPQAYCRPHQSKRNGQAQKARMQRPEARAKRRAWNRANWTRYLARRYADYQKYYAKNREKRRAAYDAWVAANPEKRKKSQDAWRERRRLRGRPVAVRPRLRPGEGTE